MSGISIWQLVIIFVILLLLFGSKKIRNIGSDLGHSIKSFRKSVKDDEAESNEEKETLKQEKATSELNNKND